VARDEIIVCLTRQRRALARVVASDPNDDLAQAIQSAHDVPGDARRLPRS